MSLVDIYKNIIDENSQLKQKGKDAEFIMERYPFLKKNVMIYDDSNGSHLLLNPYRNLSQKLSLLTKDEVLLLHLLTGRRKTKDICRRLKINKSTIVDMIRKWAGQDWNMLSLLKASIEEVRATGEIYAKCIELRNRVLREINSVRKTKNIPLLKKYHRREIRDAQHQFDNVEVTISHYFKEPHAVMGGKNYGASFANVLLKEGAIRKGASILEIGGGTGIFGKSFLDELEVETPKIYKTIQYTIFEISPALLKSQRSLLEKHKGVIKFICGDIETYDFKRKKFNVVISNEMIADLTTIKLKKTDVRNSSSLSLGKKRAIALLKKYKLDISDAFNEFLFNLGAIELMVTIKKILQPQGKAYVIEYKSESDYPKIQHITNHSEYSIHVGFLLHVATQLKMNPRYSLLVDFLPFNKKVKVINTCSLSLINDCLLPFLRRERLSSPVYTEEKLRKTTGSIFNRLSFIGFTHVGSKELLLDPSEFFVLRLNA